MPQTVVVLLHLYVQLQPILKVLYWKHFVYSIISDVYLMNLNIYKT